MELVGTTDHVADLIGAAMEEVGGDGFLITTPWHRLTRRYIVSITDGMMPAPQPGGLTRTVYMMPTWRETLLQF